MKVITATGRAGTDAKAGSKFTGSVHNFLTMPATDGTTINTVDFAPGARTYWHSHERGQILQVLAGQGLVFTVTDGAVILRPGDTVWCEPGERHWHGACPDSFMTHTAISLGTTNWENEVSDDEYALDPARAEEQSR
ncbi:cupin [Rhodococcus sp. 06-621-2]|nr:cupin domain-containing protein [Rhodococcus sp. 06-621-2]OZC59764.1 cupin [Rhodococcus sp. 06-621-2]